MQTFGLWMIDADADFKSIHPKHRRIDAKAMMEKWASRLN